MRRPLHRHRMMDLWNRFRGIPIEWDLGRYQKILGKINAHDLKNASDADLKTQAARLKARAQEGQTSDSLLVEAFALVREAAWRSIGLRPFDVQVLAGIVLHRGKLVEMNTGEGKTLAAVLPAFLNALEGKGVHVLTFNDYLARRDAAWMGPIFGFLGLGVGVIQQGMALRERRDAYAADVTYATAKEAGFDFLRDQLCTRREDLVQRPFHFAIVDEADSILIDEARVPLVIAGCTEARPDDPSRYAEIVRGLREGADFETDEGKRNIYLTEAGSERLEGILACGNLHASGNQEVLTGINQALHAEYLLRRDVDYIVRNGKIELVDEFTGRVVEDRHWPDGLQAALECKEKLRAGAGGSILGSITLQHFLRLYPKIGGMTATARPAAPELLEFYGLSVVVIPPHRPCIRKDLPDVIFTHREAKTRALVAQIQRCQVAGRPVLVGTASVEESEQLASLLSQAGISCQVLNAKNDEEEASVVARAGAPGAVTISTNMAGRGTDIKLGGDCEQERDRVMDLGGLYVIGTNRHESLRIDLQLRGRAGRQGDPGASQFFVSLQDNLIERCGVGNLIPRRFREWKQDDPLSNPIVNREVARGQRIIEGQNFDIRKTLWEYSSLVERQRDMIQRRRQGILRDQVPLDLLSKAVPERQAQFVSLLGRDRVLEIERQITLGQIDHCWAEHLGLISETRESIHLVGLGGFSPQNEFQKIVTEAFLKLLARIDERVVQSFQELPADAREIEQGLSRIRGPSSTWTHLVSDNQFGFLVNLLKGSNLGLASVGAALYTPLYLAFLIVLRFFKKKR